MRNTKVPMIAVPLVSAAVAGGVGWLALVLGASTLFAVALAGLTAIGLGWLFRPPLIDSPPASRSPQPPLDLKRDVRGSNEGTLVADVLESVDQGLVILDRSGELFYANPSARKLVGSPPAIPDGPLGKGSWSFEVHHPRKMILRATSKALESGARLIILEDVTESERVASIRRDFVADVSHELKTPVAGILASAETLEIAAHGDPEGVKRFTASLVSESRRLSALVGDLLDLARLEQRPGEVSVVEFSRLVLDEVDRISEEAENKGLDLVVDVREGISLKGRSSELVLVARNLLDNAVKYTDHGSVCVRLGLKGLDGSMVVLQVEDTGDGIPTKDQERIFERFYRVDKARSRETGGTGLGLSIVRNVIERHDGDLDLTSELGIGSTFTVRLPGGSE
jgi:two-component system sensor histidine kinase SenX3